MDARPASCCLALNEPDAAKQNTQAQEFPLKTLEAQEFRLKDGQGRLRASLAVHGDFTDLILWSPNSKHSVWLQANDYGAQVHLSGPDKAFATFDVTDTVGSGLHLHNSNSWAGVLVSESAANVTLSTPDAQTEKLLPLASRAAYPVSKGAGSATLGVDRDGSYLNVRDKANFETWLGSTGLVVPTTGETHQTSAASLVMFGKDGKTIWRAP